MGLMSTEGRRDAGFGGDTKLVAVPSFSTASQYESNLDALGAG